MLSGLHSFYQQLKQKKKMHFSFGHCPELHCNIEAYVKDTKIVLVLLVALKLEMELICGLYDREHTLNSCNDVDAENMKSVDISEG